MIYTFYSYKGGVGRSMALANVAELFYRAGLRVLMIDWDLEAPGLERFFPLDLDGVLDHSGVMDMLLQYKRQMSRELPIVEGQELPFERPMALAVDIYGDSPTGGKLYLLTAGRRSKDYFSKYANAVLTFDWQDFYRNWEGEAYLGWLRRQFEEMADVVLIDSRTGVTEMGGVCIYQFADAVVMFCAANQQSIDGTYRMLLDLKRPQIQELRGRPLEVLVIPARIENAESEFLNQFQKEFFARFASFIPEPLEMSADGLWRLGIPYIPRYAYSEIVAVREKDKASAQGMIEAFSLLAFSISRLAPRDSPIHSALPETRVQVDRDTIVRGSIGDKYVIYAEQGATIAIGDAAAAMAVLDHESVVNRYLAHLVDRYRYLELKGMGVSDRVPLRLPLVELYVPMRARIELPEGETWARDFRLMGRKISTEEADVIGRRLSGPVSVLNLLLQHDGLVVLGDPGAGKTTLLKYLALQMASGEGEALGLGERLPVLLPLSAYANALSTHDVPLGRFIADYYRDIGVDLPLGPLLDQTLAEGRALLLLDGLDEVRDLAQRHLLVQRVAEFFAFHRRQGNKFILTSRIVGYREVRPSAEGLAECTLVDFDDKEIAEFADRWTVALERAVRGDTLVVTREAAREREELLAVVQRNPGVHQLAANPLLLTILALMKRQGLGLPGRRVELYQKYVETLLTQWNMARGLGRPPTRELNVIETMRVLAPLALWMHEHSPGVGLAKREVVRRKLEEICARQNIAETEQAAWQLLADAHQYAGILVERGPGEYGFVHRALQEYLAAVAIAMQGQRGVEPVVEALAAHLADENWHEVSLLTVGYLGIVQQRDEAASEVLWQLIERAPGEPGQAVVLAGEAVADAWPGGVTATCKEWVAQTLLATMTNDAQVKPPVRAQVGYIVAKLGDPRPGVAVDSQNGLPDIIWCEIPTGPFLMGSDKHQDPQAWDDELPMHEVTLPAYWISKYPVTNAQFSAFVSAGGYDEPRYWTREGWAWRTGQSEPGLSPTERESLKQRFTEWLTDRPVERRDRPFWWDDLRGNLPNQSVVGVSWYESLALCKWLTEKMENGEWRMSVWRDGCLSDFHPSISNLQVRLPSEAEWEKAARGTNGRRWPWGNEWTEGRANTEGASVGEVCTVGIFPAGASPYGALDMAGNVWEWTSSLYRPYPYQANDGREEMDSAGLRVLRGGAFSDDNLLSRCAFRGATDPSSYALDIGFRVALIPLSRPT